MSKFEIVAIVISVLLWLFPLAPADNSGMRRTRAYIAAVITLPLLLIAFYPSYSESSQPITPEFTPVQSFTEEHVTPTVLETQTLTPTDALVIPTNIVTVSLPTITPNFPSQGLPLKDDFDDGILDGWENNGDGSVIPVDGVLEIRATSPTTAYTGEEYWHNYSISISFMIVGMENNTKYGVVVRKSDVCQLYYIRLTSFNNNPSQVFAELLKYIDCDQNTFSVLDQKVVNLDSNSWHNIYVTISGDSSANIRVWIDNQELLSFDDTEEFIYSGAIGLRVEYATIRFDNLSVELNK
jgi:hypothetical protein